MKKIWIYGSIVAICLLLVLAVEIEFPYYTAGKLIEDVKSKGSEPNTVDGWGKLLKTNGFDYTLKHENVSLIRQKDAPFTELECSTELVSLFLNYRCSDRLQIDFSAVSKKCQPTGETKEILLNFLLDGTVDRGLHLIKDRRNKRNIKLVPDCPSLTAHLIYDEVVNERSTVLEITSSRNAISETLRLSKAGQFVSIGVIDSKHVTSAQEFSGSTVSLTRNPLLIGAVLLVFLLFLTLVNSHSQNRGSREGDRDQDGRGGRLTGVTVPLPIQEHEVRGQLVRAGSTLIYSPILSHLGGAASEGTQVRNRNDPKEEQFLLKARDNAAGLEEVMNQLRLKEKSRLKRTQFQENLLKEKHQLQREWITTFMTLLSFVNLTRKLKNKFKYCKNPHPSDDCRCLSPTPQNYARSPLQNTDQDELLRAMSCLKLSSRETKYIIEIVQVVKNQAPSPGPDTTLGTSAYIDRVREIVKRSEVQPDASSKATNSKDYTIYNLVDNLDRLDSSDLRVLGILTEGAIYWSDSSMKIIQEQLDRMETADEKSRKHALVDYLVREHHWIGDVSIDSVAAAVKMGMCRDPMEASNSNENSAVSNEEKTTSACTQSLFTASFNTSKCKKAFSGFLCEQVANRLSPDPAAINFYGFSNEMTDRQVETELADLICL